MNLQRPGDGSTSGLESGHPAGSDDLSVYAVRRYALHDEIGSSSVATVHLGRMLGPERFARTVAVKRLRPQYAKDLECVSMLVDGARLAASVRHTNVVPTLDIVTGDEILVVTEYVHGESLATLLRTLRGRDAKAPLSIVSGVVAGMLRGIQAVHHGRDARLAAGDRTRFGRHDLAAGDVLVGTDGIARLIDIGMGHAGTKRPSGVSPVDDPTGGHTDVFCASVILWEALAGRSFLPRIAPDGFDPPSQYRAEVSPEVDALVARGHATDPAARFANAGEMALALEAALPPATPTEIGHWVESLALPALQARADCLAKIEAPSTRGASSSARPLADTFPGEEPMVAAPRVEPVTRRERASTAPPSFETKRGLGPTPEAIEDRVAEYGATLGASRRKRTAILTGGMASAVLVVAALCARFGGGDRASGSVETTAAATVSAALPATLSGTLPTTVEGTSEQPSAGATAQAGEAAASSEPEAPKAQTPPGLPPAPAPKASRPHRPARPRRDDVL
jgi:hypothetical protein